ncbi:hypothetical protein PHLCEN_2v11801, partial [Hermanssonia centrifuga]
MSLEFYDNRTEAEHHELDKELLESIADECEDCRTPPPPMFIWLLLVGATCPSKSYSEEYNAFFEDNREELTKLLKIAWQNKTFRQVRSLSISRCHLVFDDARRTAFLNPTPTSKKIFKPTLDQ